MFLIWHKINTERHVLLKKKKRETVGLKVMFLKPDQKLNRIGHDSI